MGGVSIKAHCLCAGCSAKLEIQVHDELFSPDFEVEVILRYIELDQRKPQFKTYEKLQVFIATAFGTYIH